MAWCSGTGRGGPPFHWSMAVSKPSTVRVAAVESSLPVRPPSSQIDAELDRRRGLLAGLARGRELAPVRGAARWSAGAERGLRVVAAAATNRATAPPASSSSRQDAEHQREPAPAGPTR